MSARNFLFLQGPHGAFFPRLGTALRTRGHGVFRINLNGGDYATWPDGDNFRQTENQWSAFITEYLARNAITDILLFGDCRPKHRVAITAAEAADIRVHVFEEGYIRSDWITLEQGGVNGRSSLPKDPDWYRAEAATLPPVPEHPPLPNYRAVRAWGAFFYYAEYVLQFWRFPLHSTHRNYDPVGEGMSHLRRFIVSIFKTGRPTRNEAHIDVDLNRDYVFFPLQLDSDYQIRVYSPFADQTDAIRMTLDDFARNAPCRLHLLFKQHPLDSELIDWRMVIAREAAKRGIEDRVTFVRGGDLLGMIRGARGVVTVNSTTGTLALSEGIATKVLGMAVYDIEGICHQGDLASFWHEPIVPDRDLYDAFTRVLFDRCLHHGAFLSVAGIDLLVQSVVAKLERPKRLQQEAAP